MSKIKGIDISSWQGLVDLSKVKESGVKFLIIREGKAQQIDSLFFRNVENSKSAGLSIYGVYHFSYALTNDQAKQEAEFCINNVEKAGLDKNTIIFYDFEYDTVDKAKKLGVTLGKAQCNEHTKIFCEYVESRGYKAGIYANTDYYKNMYDKSLIDKYVFWLADWTGDADYPCTFHQYSSKGSVPGITGNVDLDYYFTDAVNTKQNKVAKYSRQAVVDLTKSWIGKNEADGSFKSIIDIYNSYTGKFPRGTKMQYSWAWCAATWSALAIKLGYTEIMPIEISCFYLIEAAKKLGCWVENDGYVPKPGDAILYDWDDSGKGDNTGTPDHVGTVEYVSDGYIVVIEGNKDNAVKRRTISVNGKYIRGFITPKYDSEIVTGPTQSTGKTIDEIAHEVISGLWGNGDKRKKALEQAGYDYSEVQKRVNEILNNTTSSSPSKEPDRTVATAYAKEFNKNLAGTYETTAVNGLYCRNDAGTNKKAICLIPYDTTVYCYGYYTTYDNVKWLYVQFSLDPNHKYTGFVSSLYLKKK